MTFSNTQPVYDPEVLKWCSDDRTTGGFGGGNSGHCPLPQEVSYPRTAIENNCIEVWGSKIRILYLPGFVEKTHDDWHDKDQVCEFLKLTVQKEKLEPGARAEYLQKVADDATAWVESGKDLHSTAKRAVEALRSTAIELAGIDSGSVVQHVMTVCKGWIYGGYKPLE